MPVGLFTQFKASAEYSMADWDREIKSGFSRVTKAGVQVSEESALKFSTVFSCTRVIAETMGSLPLAVFRRQAGGGADQARDHPVFQLLHDAPNDEMASQSWIEAGTGHVASAGNHYAIITPNRRGQPVDLYPADWHEMTPQRNRDTGAVEYRLMDRGKPEIFPAERVLHVPGWGFDGLIGYSPIRMNAETLGVATASAEFTARFFGQGMQMGLVLRHPKQLQKPARDGLKEDLQQQGAGLANSWMPLILEEDMKLERFTMPLKDVQFIELQRLSREDICGIFRIPPHMVGILERSTNNNIEHQSLDFVKYTMLPYIRRWEQAINRRLFTPAERAAGLYAKFNVEGLLRGDYKSRQEGLQIQRQNGVINAEEWRALEEMNPIGGVAGSAYLVNGNMISTETAAKQPPRTAGNTGGGE